MVTSNLLVSIHYKQSSTLSGSTFARRRDVSSRRRASLPEYLWVRLNVSAGRASADAVHLEAAEIVRNSD